MSIAHHSIVVIGAGPAGSAAARSAAQSGTRPLLIERDASPGATNACGGLTAAKYRSSLTLPESVIEHEISHTVLRIDGRAVDFATPVPTYLSFRRAAFDAFLAQRAVAAGTELLTSTEVMEADPSSGRLVLHDRRSGLRTTIQSDVMIFADGPRTLAASHCHFGHRPSPHTKLALLWALEGEWRDGRTIEIDVNTTASCTGYFWVFPKRDHVQVGVGAPRSSPGTGLHERLCAFVDGRPDLRHRRILTRNAGMVPGEPCRKLVEDGAMIAGDAAGLVNPLTGGGIAFALFSGEIAGRVAAEAVKTGRRDAAALRPYERRFHRSVHGRWLAVTTRMRASIDGFKPTFRAAAHARSLHRYFGFFHTMQPIVNLLLAPPWRIRRSRG